MHTRTVVACASLALALGMLSTASCKSVSREPIAFSPSTWHDDGNYRAAGWVSGESCEEWATQLFGTVEYRSRVGEKEVPRSVEVAMKRALKSRPSAVFLADVVIETETRSECMRPLIVCTIVSGVAMEPVAAAAAAAAPATPKAPPALPADGSSKHDDAKPND